MDVTFEDRALELYQAQRAAIPAYDAWCAHELATRGAGAAVTTWEEVPALPIAAFKQLDVFDPARPVAAEWHSSGTTGTDRSTHRLAALDDYDHAIDLGVDAALLPDVAAGDRGPLRCVQLQPAREHAPHSSLSYMFDRIRTGPRCRDAGAWVDAAYTVDGLGAWGELERCAADGEPVVVLATSFALVLLLDQVRDAELAPIELPLGSRVVDTGGYKGRTRELTRDELVARTESWMGVPAAWCENEYGMSELSSQAWLGNVAAAAGHPVAVQPSGARWLPPTMRVRVVDPVTLSQVEEGEAGLLVFHDIANVQSCAAVRSEDIGIRRGSSFELVGRAPGAVLKGCSLHLEDVPA